MKLEYLNQSSSQSHIQNGNFSQGTAYWFGSFIKHRRILGSDEANRPRSAPEYGVEVNSVDGQFYPDGIRPGIHQFIDRADIYRYPSRRRAGGIELIPFTSQRAVLRVPSQNSTLDGKLLIAKPAPTGTPEFDDYFQHPFVFRDQNGAVGVTPASDVPWTDDVYAERTRVYKAHRTLFNYNGNLGTYLGPGDVPPPATPPPSATPPTTIGQFTFHSQLVAPVTGDSFSSVTDSTNKSIESITYRGVPTAYYIEISGDLDVLLPLFQIGDTFESISPEQFSMEIYQISDLRQDPNNPIDVIRLYVRALKISGFKVANNGEEVDKEILEWKTFRRSTGTAIVEKDLVAYDYTLATTYRADQGYQAPADSSLRFLSMDVTGDTQVTGFGDVTENVPQTGPTETTYFPTEGVTASGLKILQADPSWRRELRHFYRESRNPIDGRLMLTVGPAPFGADTTAKFTPTRFTYNQSQTNPLVTITLSGVFDPSVTFDAIKITKIKPLTTDVLSWVDRFIVGAGEFNSNALTVLAVRRPAGNSQTFEVDISADYLSMAPADPDHPYDFIVSTTSEQYESYRLVSRGTSVISDVCLYPGNLTQRFEFIELAGAADSLQRLTLSNHLLDELQHTSNEYDSVLPKGAVVLYSGGHVCPPGYKRVDGLPGSAEAGVGYGELPFPNNVIYDAASDRTEVVWDNLYVPVLNERKEPILLSDFPTAYEFEYKTSPNDPNVKLLDFEIAPVLQAVQPGLSLRTKESTFVTQNTANPLYLNEKKGKAVNLGPGGGGFATVPGDDVFDYVELPPHPSLLQVSSSIAVEMWFKFNRAIDASLNDTSEFAVLYQRLELRPRPTLGGVGLYGYDVIVRRNFQVELRLFHDSADRDNPFWTVVANNNFWNSSTVQLNVPTHLIAQLTFTTSINGTYDSVDFDLFIRQGDTAIPNAQFNVPFTATQGTSLPSGSFRDSVLVNAPAYVGRPPTNLDAKLQGRTGTLISLDSLRIFENLDPSYYFGVKKGFYDLWNQGKGTYVLPSATYQSLKCAHYFDTPNEYLVPNAAPNIDEQPLPYAKIVGTTVSWTTGYLTGVISDEFNEKHYQAPYEKLASSHLITNLLYDTSDSVLTYSSATAWNNSGSQFGQGYGDAVYPAIITEDQITQATGETAVQGIRTFPPVGDIVNKVNQFTFNGISGAVTGRAVRLNKNKFEILIEIPTSGPSNVFNSAFMQNLKVGDVFQITWDYPDAARATTHICRYIGVASNLIASVGPRYLRFARYDGRRFNSRTPKKPYWFNIATSGVSAVIRPATLYGRGQQTYDTGTRTFGFPGVTAKYFPGVSATNNGVWAYVPFESQLRVFVQGHFQPNPGDPIYLEPSGYLRYDDPGMNFGGGGHSHKVLQSDDDIGVDNLIPRINPDGGLKNVARTRVASEHHHGILAAYRYPLPAFKFFGICEKL